MRKIIPYNKRLVPLAKKLRKHMTLSEVLLWQEIKGKQLGARFSRQIPIDEFIVYFYCKDLMLVIEIDGNSHSFEVQPEKDEIRQKRIESFGIHFLRFDDRLSGNISTNGIIALNEMFEINNLYSIGLVNTPFFKEGLDSTIVDFSKLDRSALKSDQIAKLNHMASVVIAVNDRNIIHYRKILGRVEALKPLLASKCNY